MTAAILAGVREKTGKDVAAWVEVVAKLGASTRKQRVDWLIHEHGFGRVAANVIASHAEGAATNYDDQDGLLAAMYAGPKAALKPIYERLVEIGRGLGPAFSLYQCAGQTTFRRRRQFAWIKPATKTRVDLGLALSGLQPSGRLLPVTGTNEKDRVRLRFALASLEDVDAEVESWLKRAYDADDDTVR